MGTAVLLGYLENMGDKPSIEPLGGVRVHAVTENGPPLGARRVRGFSWLLILFKCGTMTGGLQAGFTSKHAKFGVLA